MKAIWSGAISFGLVNIPIKLYSASKEEKLSFDLLHKKDLSNIRYAKVCKAEGHEVPYSEIVKGFEYQKGEYVVLEEEDFKKANAKKTSLIDIVGFVDEKEIESIFYEKPYYLEPDKTAAKPYVLLKKALEETGKVGLARFVLRNKEHYAVLKPYKNILLLDQIRFESDIRQAEELEFKQPEVSRDELEMALALVKHLSARFKPQEYKDTYSKDLEKIIEDKANGRVPAVKGRPPEPTRVKDLMEVLRASLEV